MNVVQSSLCCLHNAEDPVLARYFHHTILFWTTLCPTSPALIMWSFSSVSFLVIYFILYEKRGMPVSRSNAEVASNEAKGVMQK